MFYSIDLLMGNGALAVTWVAANVVTKLSRSQLLKEDIGQSVSVIADIQGAPFSLRLSGQLLVGVSKIYSGKIRYLEQDCTTTFAKLKQAFRQANVDLPAKASSTGGHARATMVKNTVTELDLLPESDLIPLAELFSQPPAVSSMNATRPSHVSRLEDITLPAYDDSVEVGRGRKTTVEDEEDAGADIDLDIDLNFDDTSLELGRGDLGDMPPLDDDMGGDDMTFQMGATGSPELQNPPTPTRNADILGDGVSVAGEEAPLFQSVAPRPKRKLRAKLDEATEQTFHMSQSRTQSQEDLEPILTIHPRLTSDNLQYGMLTMDRARLLESIYNPLGIRSDVSRLLDPTHIRDILSNRAAQPGTPEIDVHVGDDNMDLGGMDDIIPEDNERPAKAARVTEALNDLEHRYEGDDEDEIFREELPEDNYGQLFSQSQSQNSSLGRNPNGVSEYTLLTARKLRSHLTEEEDQVQFSVLAEEGARKEKVKMFFEMLVLATKDAIAVKQREPFGEINISAKESLFADMWNEPEVVA
jgi:cohesin complex subunit SCC1